MYDALHLWFSGFRGGLAIATVIIGTVLAACVGVIAASVTMLTLVALPSMIKRNYDKSLSAGAVCAGGTLGILIPPSVMIVIYGPMAQVSVGKLFAAAFVPGFILALLYCVYIALRCIIQPKLAPATPVAERAAVSFAKKTSMLATSLFPPALLVLAVLGSIFAGVAPPTEAAGVGALAAVLLTMAYKRFSFRVLRETSLHTLKVFGMIYLIGGGAYSFVGVFLSLGCGDVIKDLILSAPGGRWGAFAMIMFIIFILGFFIDWLGIFFILIPLVAPLAVELGFDPIWFGMMIIINFQMSFMTPPFAPAIFYLRGSADPELGITIGDIIRGVVPYLVIIIFVLLLCVFFPQLLLWLPSLMVR